MKINVLLFGALADMVGQSAFTLETGPFSDIQSLNGYLTKQYPDMAKKKYLIAVNQEIVDSGYALQEGDEVALLPPFSGG